MELDWCSSSGIGGECARIKRETMRSNLIAELRAGHLGLAIKLVEDDASALDHEIRDEAVRACADSLRRHFHWIIPAFVDTFGIRDAPALKEFASKIAGLTLRHGQPLIAGAVARASRVPLDQAADDDIRAASATLATSAERADAILVVAGAGDYNFQVD